MSTVAVVNIIDRPGTGKDRLNEIAQVIKTKILDGSLQQALRESIHDAIHITPVIGDVDESYQKIKAVNISACAANMETLINRFSVAYTRHQVPHALMHACENYAQREAFSHDAIVDKHDRAKCRKATKMFMNSWKYGKGKVDYSHFCIDLCELKNGRDAIRCDAMKYLAAGK